MSQDIGDIENAIQMNILAAIVADQAYKDVYIIALGNNMQASYPYNTIQIELKTDGKEADVQKRCRELCAGDVRHAQASISKAFNK